MRSMIVLDQLVHINSNVLLTLISYNIAGGLGVRRYPALQFSRQEYIMWVIWSIQSRVKFAFLKTRRRG